MVQARDRAGQRGLARSGLADQGEALVRGDLQVDVVHDRDRAVAREHVVEREHGVADVLLCDLLEPARARDGRRPHFLGADALDPEVGRELAQRRLLGAAGVEHEGAAGRERAAGGPRARRRGPPGDPDQVAAAREVRDGLHEAARVGVRRVREQLGRRPELDDPPGVHDGRAGRERADHGEVVADVERRDVMSRRQLAHRAEHVRLRGHVEAGRRLVEHDQARAARERHGEADALLLPARELVRIAPQVLLVVGQRDLAHDLGDARLALVGARAEPVHLECLAQLRADAQGRVEGGGRILRHVRDDAAAHGAPRRCSRA